MLAAPVICPTNICVVICLLLQSLTVDNLGDVWAASEDFCAPQLAKRCVLFALEHCTEIINADADSTSEQAGASTFTTYMHQMVPALRSSLIEDLAKVEEAGAAAAPAAPAAAGGAPANAAAPAAGAGAAV